MNYERCPRVTLTTQGHACVLRAPQGSVSHFTAKNLIANEGRVAQHGTDPPNLIGFYRKEVAVDDFRVKLGRIPLYHRGRLRTGDLVEVNPGQSRSSSRAKGTEAVGRLNQKDTIST